MSQYYLKIECAIRKLSITVFLLRNYQSRKVIFPTELPTRSSQISNTLPHSLLTFSLFFLVTLLLKIFVTMLIFPT